MSLGALAGGMLLGAALAGAFLRRRGSRPPDLDLGSLGMVLIKDRKIQWANGRCAEILGVEAEALRGVGTRNCHLDEAAYERFGAEVLGVCERDGRFQGDLRLRRVDGTPFWAHLVGSPQGEQGVLWYLEDVTERVEARQGLEETLSLNQKLIAASPTGILLYRGADGACLLANPSAAHILDATPEELMGQNFRRLPSWRETGLREAADRALGSGEDQDLECHFTSALRKEVWMVARIVPFLSRGDRLFLMLVTDISVSRRIEREREVLVAELEQKNREQETLLYVASHDLRSPLVNVHGFSQRLGRSLEELRRIQDSAPSMAGFREAAAPHLEGGMAESLAFIQASCAKMDAIINGLLTLSLAGRMVLRAGNLDMNQILRACSATLAFQLQSVEGTLQVDELPFCTADAVQVTQILSNLLDNAIKYRHPHRPLRVRVTGEATEGSSIYWVEDNGRGIPPEDRERIWDIFQRLDPQGPIPGDGLGLTLVRRMAERNGGRVHMEPVPDQGCRFRLELPPGAPVL